MSGRNSNKVRALKLLSELGIEQLANRKPSQISHGQAQRVAIARAAANSPKILLADEPTSALDDESAEKVIKLLFDIAEKSGATLITASHDARIKNLFKRFLIWEANMNSFKLAGAYLKHKLANTILTIVTFAIGVAIILSLVTVNNELQDEFNKNLQGIDLVVSGKGSPLQIILSTVFQLDIPTGNIPIEEADKLKHHPLVAAAIPMALGDNYNGNRIVGTDVDYIKHYNGELAEGRFYNQQMEAVLGSQVAAKNHNKIGDKIVGAHGLVNSDDLHSDFPYTIVGILKPTGTVVDRVVLTPVESVWHVHEHPDADNPEEIAYKKEHPGNELTALLITYRSPLAASLLPRYVNKNSSMQAASPAYETARLLSLLGEGTETIRAFGILIISLGILIMFINLYNSMNERKYDLALMRSLGGTKGKLFGISFVESLILSLSGAILGIVLSYALIKLIGQYIAESKNIQLVGHIDQQAELYILGVSVIIAFIASLIPAIKVYSIDVFKTLSSR